MAVQGPSDGGSRWVQGVHGPPKGEGGVLRRQRQHGAPIPVSAARVGDAARAAHWAEGGGAAHD
eukprot:7377012-Pyramimonas_sp.AAC.1